MERPSPEQHLCADSVRSILSRSEIWKGWGLLVNVSSLQWIMATVLLQRQKLGKARPHPNLLIQPMLCLTQAQQLVSPAALQPSLRNARQDVRNIQKGGRHVLELLAFQEHSSGFHEQVGFRFVACRGCRMVYFHSPIVLPMFAEGHSPHTRLLNKCCRAFHCHLESSIPIPQLHA